jgi:hypothetical protein
LGALWPKAIQAAADSPALAGFVGQRHTVAALGAYLCALGLALLLRRLLVGIAAALLMLLFSPLLLVVWSAAKLVSLLWRKKTSR